MSTIKQNIIILQEESEKPYDISLHAGNMYLNRLCIDENAGFELSGVYRLKKAYKESEFKKTRREKTSTRIAPTGYINIDETIKRDDPFETIHIKPLYETHIETDIKPLYYLEQHSFHYTKLRGKGNDF